MLIIIGMTAPHLSVHGQQARFSLEPDEIYIGQQSRLTMEVEAPSHGMVLFPVFPDTLHIEVIRESAIDTVHGGEGILSLQQELIITSWEEGFHAIPPLSFRHILETDTTFFETRPHLLQVLGVEVDLEAAYRDIKPIFGLPRDWRSLLLWTGMALLVATALFFLLRRLLRRKAEGEEISIWEKPEVPAHIAAISSLESLRRKKLWQAGKVKEYHSELSGILRKYVHKRYEIQALEMTTVELMLNLQQEPLESNQRQSLREILSLADLVKFAKHQPAETEHDQALEKALDFVRAGISSQQAGKDQLPGEMNEPNKERV